MPLERALRDLLARHRNPHLQCPPIKTKQFVCQNSIMGQSYGAFEEYFCLPLLVWIFQIWPYPRQNSMQRPQAPAWQASPWGHSPTSSAPCAVPMRLSRICQHINEKNTCYTMADGHQSRHADVFGGHEMVCRNSDKLTRHNNIVGALIIGSDDDDDDDGFINVSRGEHHCLIV